VLTALTALRKLSDRLAFRIALYRGESVLCDQNPAECNHVKICPSLLLQHGDTQVAACSSTTHVSTFPVRSFSGLQTYRHQRKIQMFTRLCIIEGNCTSVCSVLMSVAQRCAGVQMCTRYRELEELGVLLVMLIKQDTRPQGSQQVYKM
jgi:hypothetical protein